MNIYYLFSSITFLQYYISIVIEAQKRNYKNIFILREQKKGYANVLNKKNKKLLDKYYSDYNITTIINPDLNSINGVVFMVDGDIYGYKQDEIDNSILFKLNKEKTIKISLSENLNFIPIYHNYINHVDYCIFSNKTVVETDYSDLEIKTINWVNNKKSYISNKNIFLGNTKFDNIKTNNEILRKYSLNKNDKYVLFLFAKKCFTVYYSECDLLNVYSHLRKLNYKIIVKTRPKDDINNKELKGDIYISSDIYPSETLELMKISSLCIISSSSAIEETIMSEIPCIDLISDPKPWQNKFLINPKVYCRIDNWKNITLNELENKINSLKVKNDKYYSKLKNKYIFTHKNSAIQYLNFIEKIK